MQYEQKQPNLPEPQPHLPLFKQLYWLICCPVRLFHNVQTNHYLAWGFILSAIFGIVSALMLKDVFIQIASLFSDVFSSDVNPLLSPASITLFSVIGSILLAIFTAGGIYLTAFILWGIVLLFRGRAPRGYMKSVTIVSLCSLPSILAGILNLWTTVTAPLQATVPTVAQTLLSRALQYGNPFSIWYYALIALGFAIVFRLGFRRGLGFGVTIYFGSITISILLGLISYYITLLASQLPT